MSLFDDEPLADHEDARRTPSQPVPAYRAEPQGTPANRDGQLVCPHCQTKGSVTARKFKKKGRLTATRLLGAALTAGGSTTVFGVRKGSREFMLTCSNCGLSWEVV